MAARLAPAWIAVSLCGCGPRYEGDGSGGEAGEAASGAPNGVAGTAGCAGNAGSSGAGNSGSAGTPGGGGGDTGGGGSAGGVPSGPDSVIGCPAATWPDAGLFFEPPPPGEFSTREEGMLSRIRVSGISGDGRVVIGTTSGPYLHDLPVAWSIGGGLVELPPLEEEGMPAFAFQASCDGSVVLERHRMLDIVYRSEAGQAQDVQLSGEVPTTLSMNPDASVIVDGTGWLSEFFSTPLRWTAATGREILDPLRNEIVYAVEPDGTLIAGNAEQLFEYDVETDTRTAIGMAAVDFVSNQYQVPSIKVGASGEAWVQSADLNYDSFLVWRPPAEPRSVTCPGPCRVVDVSGTARVVLLETSTEFDATSWIWTPGTGFLDLTSLIQGMGVDLGGRALNGVALSDDGRVVTGESYDPATPVTSRRLFYAVLPASTFE